MDSAARQLHAQAEEARESGDFLKALEYTDKAMILYQQDGDQAGFAEVLASRFLTLRHLYEKTGDRNFLLLAKHDAMAAVEIARESGDKTSLAVPLFNLAKAQDTLGELQEAVKTYHEAVENISNNPPATYNRPAVIADFNTHLAICEYKTGDKTALERVEQALADLEQAEEDSYNKNVWLSGGEMRIAEILHEDNPEKAKEHLQKAKEIIDADSRLKLRLAQWEKLAATFK